MDFVCASTTFIAQKNVHPKEPSVQFYKQFLDPVVTENFITKYDALAVIEWDVYKFAFRTAEPLWIKESIIAASKFLGPVSLPKKYYLEDY